MRNLPTLKELVGQQNSHEQFTTPFAMLLNLLSHDYDDTVDPENREEIAKTREPARRYGQEDSQQRSSDVSAAIFRERDDKSNDIFNEDSLSGEKIARIQRDDARTTTTPKPTTMRGTPWISSTTKSLNRGFYVTKAFAETTYAPIEVTDFPEDTTETEVNDWEQAGNANHDKNKVREGPSEFNTNPPIDTYKATKKNRGRNRGRTEKTNDGFTVTEVIPTTDRFSLIDTMFSLDFSNIEDTTVSPTTAEETRGNENKVTTASSKENTKHIESTTLIPTTIEFPITTMRMTTAAPQESTQNVRKRGRYRFRTTTNFVSPTQEHFGRKSSRRITSADRSNRREKVPENVAQIESSTVSQQIRRRLPVNRSRQRIRTKAIDEPERQRKRLDAAVAVNSTSGSKTKNGTQRSNGRSQVRRLKETTIAPEIETTTETIVPDTTSPAGAVREFLAQEQRNEETETTTGVADETIATTVDRETLARAIKPANEINLLKNTRLPRPSTRRPGTFSRNELLNRLKDRGNAQTTLPPFFSDLQSTAALLTNIRKIKPTESSLTTLPSATENIVIHVDPTELPTTPEGADNRVADVNDQAIRAQELALSLVDAPLSQATSATGGTPFGNSARRRISTTVAPRPKPTTGKTSNLRKSSAVRDRHRQKAATKVPDYVTTRPRRPPVIDYDYYEDGEERIIGKPTLNSKLLLTNTGTFRCLDQGNFPHPYSCKKFITCARMVNGVVVGAEYTCPDKLSFDPVGGICNWSAGLGCKE